MSIKRRGNWSRRAFMVSGLLLPPAYRLLSQQSFLKPTRYLTYEQIAPLFASGGVPLPPDLAQGTVAERRAQWSAWVQNHDRQIRARLIRGEEDTLVNFVMFGVSFTRQPRIAVEDVAFDPDDPVFSGRIYDFVTAVSNPRDNQRLVILKRLLQVLGYDTATADQRERVAGYIEQSIQRYLVERSRYDQTVRRALANDTASSYAATAHLYRERGLSLDTDFRPNYAIDRGLVEARRRGLLRSVRRVAIVGPGLDFADKDSGFDHYPLQSLQPFALVDSLLRLGLNDPDGLQVTLFDISVPLLEHLSDAVERAKSGRPYTMQLILNRAGGWRREVLAYWEKLGDQIGVEVPPLPVPGAAANFERRAVRVTPEIVTLFEPVSLNIAAQTLDLPEDQRFDLVIATNVFIYYDTFDQALALLNLQSMLAAGGAVLTNDLFENFPGLRLQTVASLQVDFTDSQADQIQIYAVPSFRPQLPPQ